MQKKISYIDTSQQIKENQVGSWLNEEVFINKIEKLQVWHIILHTLQEMEWMLSNSAELVEIGK